MKCNEAMTASKPVWLVHYSFCGGGINTSIEDETGVSALNIYPNPSTNNWRVSVDQNGSDRIKGYILMDVMGKEIQNNQLMNETSIELIGNNLPDGIYLLTVYTKNGKKYSNKLIKY